VVATYEGELYRLVTPWGVLHTDPVAGAQVDLRAHLATRVALLDGATNDVVTWWTYAVGHLVL